jgi:UDP-N-acetylmuramyl pentapeptide phosphotransferase/UDP-N-acetylglucosamine-1-phosphate transferase
MAMIAMPVALAAVALLLAFAAVAVMLRWRARLPQAAPGARSLHAQPVPRVGGVALWIAWAPAVLLAPPPVALMGVGVWGAPFLLLVVVSLADDVRALGVLPRLAAHLAAAIWLALVLVPTRGAEGMEVLYAGACIALVCAWSLNLYNFMDGSDGLAATMAIVGFGAYAAVAWLAGLPVALLVSLVAAALPLLWVNRPPARMFLGDVGAVPLGFLAAAIGFGGIVGDVWPAWFPALVFLPFLADATVTLGLRLVRGERVWEAHNVHYYQRLHRLGAGHRGTLAVYGALMAGTASTAVACANLYPAWGSRALVAWCAVCLLLFAAIDYHWRKRKIAST